jgi:uncharacterized protein with PIN domain
MMDSPGEERERFIADVMLGKLAKWMRILGWDVDYDNRITDSQLLRIARKEKRTILTRDRRMIEERKVDDYLLIENDDPEVQLREVVRRYGRPREERILERCLRCNVLLESRDRGSIESIVPEYVASIHRRFSSCPSCGRIYWRGSHYLQMVERLKAMLGDRGEEKDRSS